MCTISFHRRPSTRGAEFPGSVFVRLIHRREVVTVTSAYRLNAAEWDVGKRCVVIPPGVSPERRAYLCEAKELLGQDRERLLEQIRLLNSRGKEYTLRDVSDVLGYRADVCMLKEYAMRQSALLKARGQECTAAAYQTSLHVFMRFNNGNDLPLAHLDGTLMHNYEAWLKERRCMLNTISFYMRNLRAIYNRAINEGLIDPPKTNPFSGVYTGVQVTKKRALTITELQMLESLNLLEEKEEKEETAKEEKTEEKEEEKKEAVKLTNTAQAVALGIFLFCFHARGMSFVDVAYLKKTDVSEGRISYTRRKTGLPLNVCITPPMQAIIKRFGNKGTDSPFLFPLIRDAKKPLRPQYLSALRLQNRRLKQIGALMGLDKPLTTHVSRHSWATVAKLKQIPIWIISEALGHTNERTTRVYLDSFGHTVLDKASAKVSKAIKKAV